VTKLKDIPRITASPHPQPGANFVSRFFSREEREGKRFLTAFLRLRFLPPKPCMHSLPEFHLYGNYSGHPFFQRETRYSFPRRGKE
jgi:hypothetical protein